MKQIKNTRIPKPGQSLTEKFPDIAKEWHHEKNGELNPCNISYGSHYKAWWKCEKGHEFEQIISNRTYLKNNCPFCYKEKISQNRAKDEMKICAVCMKQKSVEYFSKNKTKSDGFNGQCKDCNNSSGYSTTKASLKRILKSKKSNAKRNVIEFDLDINWLIKKWKKCKGKCEITGFQFAPINQKRENGLNANNSLSFDRIDPNKGYIKENTQLILLCVNSGKGQFNNNDINDIEVQIQIQEKLLEYLKKQKSKLKRKEPKFKKAA